MSLTGQDRAQFVSDYSRALVTSWSNEAFSRQLDDEPRIALAQVGITLPADARVHVVRPTARPDDQYANGVDRQLELYESGLATGLFEFYFPDAPLLDTSELAMAELHGVAAGGIWDPYCCSCCPSCCSASGTP